MDREVRCRYFFVCRHRIRFDSILSERYPPRAVVSILRRSITYHNGNVCLFTTKLTLFNILV